MNQLTDFIMGGGGKAGEEGNKEKNLEGPLTLFNHTKKNWEE